jgi:hypothetical protein
MVTLVQFVTAVCPQQKISRETTIPWYEIIGDLPFTECRAAVITLKHSQAFIDPSDIIREVRRARGRPYDITAPEAIEAANQRALNAGGASPETGALWRNALAKAQQESAQRRAAVLAHPDLAALLCQPPLGYSSPDKWNGFIPPRFLPPDSKGIVQPNASPGRAVLVAISAEALDRDGAHDAVPASRDPLGAWPEDSIGGMSL